MNLHALTAAEALRILESDSVNGLNREEAEARLKKYGSNRISSAKRPSLLKRFFSELSDFMTVTLIISAAVSFAVSRLNGETDFTDPVIMLAIVIVNAVIGIIQEYRAENAIAALKGLTDPKAHCIRDKKTVAISSDSVTVGDILCLKAGDMVCADARIIESSAFTVNEAALTGESNPVLKNSAPVSESAPVSDRSSIVYSSTLVTGGHARAVVFAVGGRTRVGQLAQMMNEAAPDETPLSKRLASVGKVLAFGAFLCCILIFTVGIIKHFDPFFMFMTSVSLAVAAIPEGLPAIVTVMLAVGVSSMAKKKAVVRSLTAVETLGSATVICSDKTGTLTRGQMTVSGIFGDEARVKTIAALCSDTDEAALSGTEGAIVNAFGDRSGLFEKYPRLDEIPFSSERKCMYTLHRNGGAYFTAMKGAFDVVAAKCTRFSENGTVHELTAHDRKKIIAECTEAAEKGLRVIGVAASLSSKAVKENGLCFLGALMLSDPLRPEAKKAVSECLRAGIEVVMITGDHKDTALYTARALGISDKEVVTGGQLIHMSDEELSERVRTVRVFARVLPEHKVRIVKAFKSRGHIVAMTGDGVNDAPALKAADIGCAMGKGGTDVARCASDMILTDDNFSTIVDAVHEGRIIFESIKKAIHFLVSSNIGEILLMLVGILRGFGAVLLPIQLLWVNLITDSLPAIALGMDRADDGVMLLPPKKPDEGFLSAGDGAQILLEGCLIGAVSLAAYSFGRFLPGGGELVARTMAFCTLSLSQIVHAFGIRSKKSVLRRKSRNPWLYAAAAVGLFLQCSVCVIPGLNAVFKTVPLSAAQWLATAFFSLVPFFTSELSKIDKRKKSVYNS